MKSTATKISRWKWITLVALFVAWLLFTILYASLYVVIPQGSTPAYEIAKFVFLSVAVLGVLFTSLLSSFNSLEATFNVQDTFRFNRIENSFKYMAHWDTEALKQARDLIRQLGKEEHTLSAQELCNRIEKNPDLERSILNMLNFFEEIYLSIEAGRVDEVYLKKSFKDVYIALYRLFSPWFIKRLEATTSHANDLHSRWRD